jgi:phage terminase large subunit-like protein
LFADEFPELEAELGAMVTGGVYIGLGRSPDRADAMAWAMAALSRLGAGAAGEEA